MGRNEYGQLGLGAADNDFHPAPQLAALESGVVQVAAGEEDFSAALTAGGEVYLWGRNSFGQLGNGECSPYTGGSYCGDDNCCCEACLGQPVAAPAQRPSPVARITRSAT